MKHTIIQITSGRGPEECCWVVAQVLKELLKEAGKFSLSHEIVHREPGDQNGTLKTALVKLEGRDLEDFLKNWVGTIQWIGQSAFRKLHKRKNWYIGINRLSENKNRSAVLDSDIKYKFTRSGGPGGQHVNKVSTAVRATHIRSGETVFVSQGRSQHQNKTEAKRRLVRRLEEKELGEEKERAKTEWESHYQLERGNPTRVFIGGDFKPNHKNKKYKASRKRAKQRINQSDD